MEYDLAILGAGAAGMMAAVAAGERLHGPPPHPAPRRIAIFERNVQPGIKVLVCGGGRCNFTNAGSVEFLIRQFGRNGRFLTPALQHLDNEALRDFFANLGVPSHVEPGGKVYPDSNQAQSVVDALVRRMRELGVAIFTGSSGTVAAVERIKTAENAENAEDRGTGEFQKVSSKQEFSATSAPSAVDLSAQSGAGFHITTAAGESVTARILLLAVGGMSYQRMGTIGDGYRFAQALGHTIATPRPAIVGLLTKEEWGKTISGLAVRDVEITIVPSETRNAKRETRKSEGDMLFTHFGISGPAILNPSEIIAELLEKYPEVTLKIDFAPHTTNAQAHAILRDWKQHQGKKLLRKMLSQHTPDITITSTSSDKTAIPPSSPFIVHHSSFSIPSRLAEKILELEQIPTDQPCSTLTSSQIHRLVERIKNCPFTIFATRGFKEAMVTAGGIKLTEVNPRTYESKICKNLFLTGEVLDLTGPSGGYNLQLAFSTGHLAGTIIGRALAPSTRNHSAICSRNHSACGRGTPRSRRLSIPLRFPKKLRFARLRRRCRPPGRTASPPRRRPFSSGPSSPMLARRNVRRPRRLWIRQQKLLQGTIQLLDPFRHARRVYIRTRPIGVCPSRGGNKSACYLRLTQGIVFIRNQRVQRQKQRMILLGRLLGPQSKGRHPGSPSLPSNCSEESASTRSVSLPSPEPPQRIAANTTRTYAPPPPRPAASFIPIALSASLNRYAQTA